MVTVVTLSSVNMNSATNSIAIKHGIPILCEENDFEDWLHETEIWQLRR